MSELLTTAQAAEFLQLSEYTVRELMKRGELKSVRVSNRWRTRLEWLEAYVDGRAA